MRRPIWCWVKDLSRSFCWWFVNENGWIWGCSRHFSGSSTPTWWSFAMIWVRWLTIAWLWFTNAEWMDGQLFCIYSSSRAHSKKLSQSLWLSSENPFDCKFLKMFSVIVYSFVRSSPNLQVCRLSNPALPTALIIKGVYVKDSKVVMG